MKYTARLKGQVPKLVTCEECALEYVYLFHATAEGTGSSALFLDNQGAQDRARAKAEAELAATLQSGNDVVPCPRCGRIQQHMVPLARSRRLLWLVLGAVGLFLLVPLFALTALVYTLTASNRRDGLAALNLWYVVLGLVVGGIGMIVLRVLLNRRYDPNASPADRRKQIGQSLAVPKEDFLKLAESEAT